MGANSNCLLHLSWAPFRVTKTACYLSWLPNMVAPMSLQKGKHITDFDFST